VSLDLDRPFTSELTRRAAAHLCDRPERGPRRAAIPSRRSSPSSRSAPPTPTLESEALTLELTRLDREISATRAAGTGGVAPLVGRCQFGSVASVAAIRVRSRVRSLAVHLAPPAEFA
jgi:hypothetical protein